MAVRSRVADPVEVERGRNRPGDGKSVRRAYEPDDSDAGSIVCVKAQDRLDHFTAGHDRPAGSERCGIHPKFGGANLARATAQLMAEVLVSA
jgi:hypothetical protein